MSITDELRAWAKEHLSRSSILAIADRIDAEHEMATSEFWAKINAVPATDENMAEHGWVRLPKDADGEYIRIGDVMAYEDNTKPMQVVALVPPAVFMTEEGPRYADMCRHYRKPTVEDVMVEFAIDWESAPDGEDKTAVLKEYVSKLQLRGEDA